MTKKSCFVIAPIGAEGSDTRKRSNQVLKYVIAPAVADCEGYGEPQRADQLPTPGIITSQIVQHVLSADLVIADLSEANPNVFYELAIRHAVRRPVVQIAETGSTIPFDLAPARTVIFDHHDLDSVEEAKKRMTAQIKAAEADPANADNPLSTAIDVQHWRASEKPIDRAIGELVDQVKTLAAQHAALVNTLSGRAYLSGNLSGLGGLTREQLAALTMNEPGDIVKGIGLRSSIEKTTDLNLPAYSFPPPPESAIEKAGRRRALGRMPDGTKDKKE